MRYDQYPAKNRLTDSEEAIFVLGVIWVWDSHGQKISKHCRRFFERDAMFAQIAFGLDRIPFKFHPLQYCRSFVNFESYTCENPMLALRNHVRLEQEMAALVAAQPFTSTPVRGLGASDTAGGTHLFAVAPVAKWWLGLVEAVQHLTGIMRYNRRTLN